MPMVVRLSSSPFTGMASSMDSPDCSSPPRRERRTQGSLTANLKPGKVSHKVRKNHTSSPPPQRPPVIIYVTPPTAIHVEPGNFKTVVQRLTGPSPESFPAAPGGRPESPASPSGCLAPSNPPLSQPPAAAGLSQASYEGKSAAEDEPTEGGGAGLDRPDFFAGLSPLQHLPPVSPGYNDDLFPPFQEGLFPPSSSHLFTSLAFSSPATDATFSTITAMNLSTFKSVKEEEEQEAS